MATRKIWTYFRHSSVPHQSSSSSSVGNCGGRWARYESDKEDIHYPYSSTIKTMEIEWLKLPFWISVSTKNIIIITTAANTIGTMKERGYCRLYCWQLHPPIVAISTFRGLPLISAIQSFELEYKARYSVLHSLRLNPATN